MSDGATVFFWFLPIAIIIVLPFIIYTRQKNKAEDEKRQQINEQEELKKHIEQERERKKQEALAERNKRSYSRQEVEVKPKEPLSKYVVFDLETTGLSPRKNEIVEIGAVKVEDGQIVDTFSTLVKPRNEITAEVTEVNGITNEMLSDAPSINIVLPKFKKFIGGCTLVAHNAEFDCKFLYIAFARFKLNLTNKYVDTLEMARNAYPQLGNHKLGTLCQYLNIENETAHRALSDTQATQKVFSRLSDITPAVTHKIKPISNIKIYDTRLNEKTKNIKELIEIIAKVSGKSTITDHDLTPLRKWLASHPEQQNEFPANCLSGLIDKTDRDQLSTELKALTDITFSKSYEKPIFIDGKTIVLDGEFRKGSFEEVSKALLEKGATVKSRAVKKADYFVIGEFGSPDWAFGNYGANYKTMHEYIDSGAKAIIVSERDFYKALK